MANSSTAVAAIAILLAGLASAAPASAAPPGDRRTAKVVVDPSWVTKPTGEQIAQYYPAQADSARIGGRVVIECHVQTSGSATDCTVISEDPPGLGFGEAAVKLAALFKMRPKTVDGVPVSGAGVTVPIEFDPSPLADPLEVMDNHPTAMSLKRHFPQEWAGLRARIAAAQTMGASEAELGAISQSFFASFRIRFRAAIGQAPYPAIRQVFQGWLNAIQAEEAGGGCQRYLGANGVISTVPPTSDLLIEAGYAAAAAAEAHPISYEALTKDDERAIALSYLRFRVEAAKAAKLDPKKSACLMAEAMPQALLALPPELAGRMWGTVVAKAFESASLAWPR